MLNFSEANGTGWAAWPFTPLLILNKNLFTLTLTNITEITKFSMTFCKNGKFSRFSMNLVQACKKVEILSYLRLYSISGVSNTFRYWSHKKYTMTSRGTGRLTESKRVPSLGKKDFKYIELIRCFLSGTTENGENWGHQPFQCQIVQAKNYR